jgi:hypothetical protein
MAALIVCGATIVTYVSLTAFQDWLRHGVETSGHGSPCSDLPPLASLRIVQLG